MYSIKAPLAFLMLSFIAYSPLVQAQNDSPVEWAWGDTYVFPKKQMRIGQIQTSTGEIYTVGHHQETALCLEKLDNSLRFQKETFIPLANMPDKYKSETILLVGGKTYWFYSASDKKSDKEMLYAREVDLGLAKFSGEPILLKETGELIPYSVPVNYYKTDFTGNWQFSLSPGNDKLLIQNRKLGWNGEHANRKEVLETLVLDNNLTKLSERTFSLPYVEPKVNYDRFQVDDQGSVYCLVQLYNEDKGRSKLRPFRYELLKWTGEGEPIKIPVPLQGKFVVDAKLEAVKGVGYILGGFYSVSRSATYPAGAFVLQLDIANNQLKDYGKGLYPFPPAVTQRFIFDRKNSRKSAPGVGTGSTQTYVKQIAVNEQNDISIYGEDRFEEEWGSGSMTRSYSPGGAPRPSYQHNFTSIIAVSLDKENLKWSHIIPKIQRGTDDPGRLSFKHFSSQNSDFLFFIDNPKNLDLQSDEYPALHMEGAAGTLVAVQINEDGVLTKNALFDIRDEGTSFPVTALESMADRKRVLIMGDERKGELRNGYLILP